MSKSHTTLRTRSCQRSTNRVSYRENRRSTRQRIPSTTDLPTPAPAATVTPTAAGMIRLMVDLGLYAPIAQVAKNLGIDREAALGWARAGLIKTVTGIDGAIYVVRPTAPHKQS